MLPTTIRRRGALASAMLGAALPGLLATRPASAQAAALTDADILNFALNLEYLEAEFYLRAVTGEGLTPADTGCVGTPGSVIGGRRVAFANRRARGFAEEIAQDELNHVRFLRAALGNYAVAEPTIDLTNSFNAAAQAAGLGDAFDPFADEQSFLLGAFVFEDVGVTAYAGAADFIQNKAFLTAAASILAVEAYHAGEIRTRLLMQGMAKETAQIAKLRASASGAEDDQGVSGVEDDQGVRLDGKPNIVPTDANSLAFTRTPQQVLNIVYLGGAAANNGFFPNKLNGSIA